MLVPMRASFQAEVVLRRQRGEQLIAAMDDAGALPNSDTQVVFGVIGIVLAIGLVALDDSPVAGRLFGWTSLLFLAALLLLVTGIEGLRRRNRRLREVDRALGEWHGLCEGLAAQANPTQWLRQRGYREFEVRHWIEREAARQAADATPRTTVDAGAGEQG